MMYISDDKMKFEDSFDILHKQETNGGSLVTNNFIHLLIIFIYF